MFSFVAHFEGDGIEAKAVAGFAGDADGGEKLEIDRFVAEAPAGAAHAAHVVGAEMAGLEPFGLGEGQRGVMGADEGLDIGIGADVGAGGLPDGALIDGDHFVESGEAVEAWRRDIRWVRFFSRN